MAEKRYLKWYNKVGYGSGDIAGNVGKTRNTHGSTKITAAIKDNILYVASFRGFISYSSFFLPSTFRSAQQPQQKAYANVCRQLTVSKLIV